MEIELFYISLFLLNFSIAENYNCYQNTTQNQSIVKNSYKRQREDIREDANLLVPELIRKMGYICEIHHIVTNDGYILEVFRISYNENPTPMKLPILMVHGLSASSADWIIMGPEHSLPFMLLRNGNDVWLLNARGTRYSRTHTYLNPDVQRQIFFNFSFHEIGTLDLPATIDYILYKTLHTQILYIGHSQGSTTSYILCSEKPEYNDKIKAVFSLGPSAFLTHTSEIGRLFASGIKLWQAWFEKEKVYEVRQNKKIINFCKKWCEDRSQFQSLCLSTIALLSGGTGKKINGTLFPVLCGHSLAGFSSKQMFHYLQIINSGRFCQFDYGPLENMKRYNSVRPPDYHLENIRVPIHLFYSKFDIVNTEKDVSTLYSKLRNVQMHAISDEDFGHVDFLFAINAANIVYKPVLDLINSYSINV